MIPEGTKVYFALEPADFRRSFDGLAATCMSALSKDPRDGGLFVFLNRRGDQVRVLFRESHGWCLLSKRLDRGRFRKPKAEQDEKFNEAEVRALMRFLDDIDFSTRTRGPSASSRGLRVVSTPCTKLLPSPPTSRM